MVANDYTNLLNEQFNGRLRVIEKRPDVAQLVVPLYHEDGDLVDIFLQPSPVRAGDIRVCDRGMTLMRLSYWYDIDSETKERIFQKILTENGLTEEEGNLYLDTKPQHLYPAVLQFAQTVAKVSSMRAFRREMIHSLFFEMLGETVKSQFARFEPQGPYYPLPDQEEYQVNYCINHRPKPIYLFGVNSPATAKLTTISCLKFQNEGLRFCGVVVLEDLDAVGKKDQNRLLSAADKVFPSLDDLRQNGERFVEREAV